MPTYRVRSTCWRHTPTFFTPPQYLLDEHEKSLAKATFSLPNCPPNLSSTNLEAKAEFAYITALCSRPKIAWPLLAVGKIADIVIKQKRGGMNNYNPMNIAEDDIVKALTILDRPFHRLNDLCQERIDHILATPESCNYRKGSFGRRLFLKTKQSHVKSSLRLIRDLISHFSSSLEAFWRNGWSRGIHWQANQHNKSPCIYRCLQQIPFMRGFTGDSLSNPSSRFTPWSGVIDSRTNRPSKAQLSVRIVPRLLP